MANAYKISIELSIPDYFVKQAFGNPLDKTPGGIRYKQRNIKASLHLCKTIPTAPAGSESYYFSSGQGY